jgi:hypothetical protein
MAQAEESEAAKASTRRRLIAGTCLAAPAAILSAVLAVFTPMLFDAPGATGNPAVLLLAASLLLLPLACIVTVVGAWTAFGMGRYRLALRLWLLPVVVMVAVLAAATWIQVGYGGRFGH